MSAGSHLARLGATHQPSHPQLFQRKPPPPLSALQTKATWHPAFSWFLWPVFQKCRTMALDIKREKNHYGPLQYDSLNIRRPSPKTKLSNERYPAYRVRGSLTREEYDAVKLCYKEIQPYMNPEEKSGWHEFVRFITDSPIECEPSDSCFVPIIKRDGSFMKFVMLRVLYGVDKIMESDIPAYVARKYDHVPNLNLRTNIFPGIDKSDISLHRQIKEERDDLASLEPSTAHSTRRLANALMSVTNENGKRAANSPITAQTQRQALRYASYEQHSYEPRSQDSGIQYRGEGLLKHETESREVRQLEFTAAQKDDALRVTPPNLHRSGTLLADCLQEQARLRKERTDAVLRLRTLDKQIRERKGRRAVAQAAFDTEMAELSRLDKAAWKEHVGIKREIQHGDEALEERRNEERSLLVQRMADIL